MITIYATIDRTYHMSKELFAPTGVLKRNRERFNNRSKDTCYIVSEDVYHHFIRDNFKPREEMIVISDTMFRDYTELHPTHDKHVAIDGIVVTQGYSTALPRASENRRDVTILAGPGLLHEIIIGNKPYDCLFLVRVDRTIPGPLMFPFPITESFKLIDEEPWPADADNPYDAVCQIYYHK